MTNPVAQIHHIDNHGVLYDAIAFVCPGCKLMHKDYSGLHLLPVNRTDGGLSWDWNGDLEAPTLSPSILTGRGEDKICHGYLENGKFRFLGDSNHELANQENIPMVPLEDWMLS